MRRRFAWLAGVFGAAALLLRRLRRRRAQPDAPAEADPAAELRRRLAEAREAPDDRDEFDAAEGVPIDEVERGSSVDERRRQVHEQAQAALDDMHDGGSSRDE
jgi:hypothetical protein